MDEQIEHILDKLTPKQRDVAILRLVNNMTFGQIGIKLGISRWGAYYRYKRAIARAKTK